jgi:hypothetical protein
MKVKKPEIACVVCLAILLACTGIVIFVFEPLKIPIRSIPGLCLTTTSAVAGLAMIWFAGRADANIGRNEKK